MKLKNILALTILTLLAGQKITAYKIEIHNISGQEIVVDITTHSTLKKCDTNSFNIKNHLYATRDISALCPLETIRVFPKDNQSKASGFIPTITQKLGDKLFYVVPTDYQGNIKIDLFKNLPKDKQGNISLEHLRKPATPTTSKKAAKILGTN